MIQNIVITKLGSEADNQQRTIFSSTTPWETGGENLVVYKNGILIFKPSDYSVTDRTHITLSVAITPTDQITMLVTKFKSDEFDLPTLDRVAKKFESKTQTSTSKNIFEESIPSNLIVHSDDVWATDIPSNPADAINLGVAYLYDKITLVQDLSVEYNKGWYSTSNGQLTGRIANWIPPRFGLQYTVRLYDANNIEIPSSDDMGWKWDYSAGYLFIEKEHNHTTPFKIYGFRYIGEFGGVPGGGAANWKPPVPSVSGLPTYGNLDGDVRLVLDVNLIYRWNNVTSAWTPTTFSSARFKDPVLTINELPTTENIDGDFRLVLSNNGIYRWVTSTSQWVSVLTPHNHDSIYYQKSYIDSALASKSNVSHEHHTLYYNKNEVDSMVRWRPPVADEAHLPPYTENRDGDMILTLDTKTIWRFDYFGFNQGQWVPILTAQLFWLDPVQDVADLPATGNTVGVVRLVISESRSYFWTGSEWTQLTGYFEHNHDTLYYRKEEIRWRFPVANESALPLIDNTVGDVRVTLNNNNIYTWSGAAWILMSASPRWREPVELLANLPTIGNTQGDLRIVRETKSLYQWTGLVWEIVINPVHDHDDRYYTKMLLNNGQLDTRYYTKPQVNLMFDLNIGHDHDGINSKKITWSNIANLPNFYWKNPVVNIGDLPLLNNTVGDARIVLNDAKIYYWTGIQWENISGSGGEVGPHDHDDRYYTEQEIDDALNNLLSEISIQLALKADADHIHDDRYYRKSEVDAEFTSRFDINAGHDHDGSNSKRISYYNLTDVPPPAAHDHNDLYYLKEELQTSGESEVNWDNIVNKPDLGNAHWKSPVQTVADLPLTDNEIHDLRMVLDDSDLYEWSGSTWVFIGHWENQYVAFWREPVQTYTDLPIINNVNGDIRLVLEENMIYRWDSAAEGWIIVSTNRTELQVYLNGLLQMPNVDYARIKEKSIKLLFTVQEGSRLSIIITGDSFQRRDWICYYGQDIFEINNHYHRQDWISLVGATDFFLTKSYIMGHHQLLVWLNGDLQKPGTDYNELTPLSFQFATPVNINDHVTAIIMNQASGEGEYVYEDQTASQGQQTFVLNNFYVPGTSRLLVYYNGDLLKLNDDYREITNNSIEMVNRVLNYGERMTFIIFGNTTAAGIGNGCCNAKDVILGTPTDGDYDDGLLDLYEETKVNDAIDWINETLVDIAPPPPETFENKNFELNGLSLFSGYVSAGNTNYETSAGQYHSYLTENNSFFLVTPNTTAFGNADRGILKLYINGVVVDTFRLYAAFVEDNINTNQSAVSYGIQAAGARENEGHAGTNGAIRNSSSGYISILSVGKYNNFKRWQKGQARINITGLLLRHGYNTVYLEHDLTDVKYRTRTLKFFYDNSGNRPYLDDTIVLEENQLNSTKYVSGIRYYSIGDRFRTTFSAFRVFNNTYAAIPVKFDMPGLQPVDIAYNHPNITGPASPPRIGDFFDFDGIITLNQFNEHSINAVISISTFDPFGSGGTGASSANNKLVNTFTNGSTDLIEYFRDEVFRLPAGEYNSTPSPRINVWQSQNLLTNGQALLFNNRLKYPNTNFTSFKPTQLANYESFSGAQRYYRSFYKQSAKNSGTLVINGITPIELVGNAVLIDLKLPTQTGWLSLNKNYDVSTFQGQDGDGCLLNVSGNQFAYSSGTFSTANSGFMVIVRITLPGSSAPELTYMEMVWP